jgi:rapamycin-insensitive companion of mTOR
MDNMRAIRSLVDTLRIPSLETRVLAMFVSLCVNITIYPMQEIILDIFFELLNIKSPEWYQTFIDGRRLTSM